MGNIVTFYSSGNKVSIKWINDDELDDFIEYVNKKIDGKEKGTQNVLESEHNPSNDDLESFKKIKMLKELLDIGAITQDEFETKKKQLLNL
nr:SHOCT domain-containing protein [Staphylococcus haemolyticus]